MQLATTKRASNWPPPAASEAQSEAPVSIGRSRGRGTLSVGKGRRGLFLQYYALSIPTISHSALSLYMHS